MPKTTKKKLSRKTTKKTTKKSVDKSLTRIKASANWLPKPLPKKTIDKLVSGRPSKYHPCMCKKVIEIMREGRSKEDAAIMMGISHITLDSWINPGTEEKPNTNFKEDFLIAVKIGEALSANWWREAGRQNLGNKDFNATLYMMNMQNRHGWSRNINGKLETKHTEKNINITRHEHVLSVEEESKEYVAEFLKVLIDSGAINARIEEDTPAETH